jgi:hypothetical protein
MFDDTGLRSQEIATVDRACRWIVIGDARPEILRSFIANSISDFDLAMKVSGMTTGQLSALLRELRELRLRRQRA